MALGLPRPCPRATSCNCSCAAGLETTCSLYVIWIMGPAPSLSRGRRGNWIGNDLVRSTGTIHSNSHCADTLRSGSRHILTSSYPPSWYAASQSGHACRYRHHRFPQHGLLWGRCFSSTDAHFNPRSDYDHRWRSAHRCNHDLDSRIMVAGKTGSPARTPPARNCRSAPDCPWSRRRCASSNWELSSSTWHCAIWP